MKGLVDLFDQMCDYCWVLVLQVEVVVVECFDVDWVCCDVLLCMCFIVVEFGIGEWQYYVEWCIDVWWLFVLICFDCVVVVVDYWQVDCVYFWIGEQCGVIVGQLGDVVDECVVGLQVQI